MSTITTKFGKLSFHKTTSAIRSLRKSIDPAKTIGFVPTMGALHDGHLSLVRKAREENDMVIASVFVNPTQFGEGEDLDKYPRQLDEDSRALADLGVDHLFIPEAASMYSSNHVTYIDPQGFDDIPEGIARPGHFRGVATIVTKLFNIVQPHRAYFGQKDAAQCVLIRRIVEDLNMDVDVQVLDTVRESDGLAMSSRNAYLDQKHRRAAPVVYQSLCNARSLHLQLKEDTKRETIHSSELEDVVRATLVAEPLVSEIQYISVDSAETMQPLVHVTKSGGAVISLACKVGTVRLIDNIII